MARIRPTRESDRGPGPGSLTSLDPSTRTTFLKENVMRHLFRPKSSHTTSKVAASRARRPRRQQPALEALEGRQLLALVGPEFTVNAGPRAQFQPDVASSPGGLSVVVWQEQVSSTNSNILAQRYTAAGTPVGLVVPIEVTGANATAPAVAMD